MGVRGNVTSGHCQDYICIGLQPVIDSRFNVLFSGTYYHYVEESLLLYIYIFKLEFGHRE